MVDSDNGELQVEVGPLRQLPDLDLLIPRRRKVSIEVQHVGHVPAEDYAPDGARGAIRGGAEAVRMNAGSKLNLARISSNISFMPSASSACNLDTSKKKRKDFKYSADAGACALLVLCHGEE
eukprot:CAMPEP_0176012348 /NCGR_PEP_ID=MMETSP0120_2-20121206/5749_1 /TAXON_ID=160619 /ORGANISM="Kryptoperidinium foliaceum, Strain CCMP 1326" /LENGTH=121 /DNA_ID=CAMNT_0017345231 /DNA_START=116 /DNA_END=479 /DNA_ORIENTATION=-